MNAYLERFTIDINDTAALAFFKLQNENYLFVLESMKLIGTLSRKEMQAALSTHRSIDDVKIKDIYCKSCYSTTHNGTCESKLKNVDTGCIYVSVLAKKR